MFEEEIKIIKQNIGNTVSVITGTARKCEVIGYGIVKNPYNDSMTLKVLMCDKNPLTFFKAWEWKENIDNFIILVDKDLNPDKFVDIPYNFIHKDSNKNFTTSYY